MFSVLFHKKMASSVRCCPEKPHKPRGSDIGSQMKLSAIFDTVVKIFSCLLYSQIEKKLFINADTAFVSMIFSNWKDAACEEISDMRGYICYKEACVKVIILPSTIHTSSLSLQHKVECMQREVAVFFRI